MIDIQKNASIVTMFYLMGDQPTTCPKCGARTDMLSNFLHTNARMLIEECLDPSCGYVFFVQEDDEDPEVAL